MPWSLALLVRAGAKLTGGIQRPLWQGDSSISQYIATVAHDAAAHLRGFFIPRDTMTTVAQRRLDHVPRILASYSRSVDRLAQPGGVVKPRDMTRRGRKFEASVSRGIQGFYVLM
jgi:hypothetical protein